MGTESSHHLQPGYGILVSPGSTLDMKQTCFEDNDFAGTGSVVVMGTNTSVTSANVFGTFDDDLTCPFISIVQGVKDPSPTCQPFDTTQCILSMEAF